jgi:hypothetical protein
MSYKLKDYTGEKYQHLTFVNFAYRRGGVTYWKLKCDCGNEVVRKAGKVIEGDVVTCGECKRWKDHAGQKYGKLTFIERVSGGVGKRTLWRLSCECGREIIAMSDNVIGGGTRSCGCVRRHGAKTFITGILDNYTRKAKQRGLPYRLTRERFIELIHQPCFYCGDENSNTWLNKRTGEQYSYNGIDRYDNSKGYEEGNVVSCCAQCNWVKSDMSGDDFIAWIRKVVAYQDQKTKSLAESLFRIDNA